MKRGTGEDDVSVTDSGHGVDGEVEGRKVLVGGAAWVAQGRRFEGPGDSEAAEWIVLFVSVPFRSKMVSTANDMEMAPLCGPGRGWR